jgi:hypothetical protein
VGCAHQGFGANGDPVGGAHPKAIGSICMRNLEIIDLFDRVRAGDTVLIEG